MKIIVLAMLVTFTMGVIAPLTSYGVNLKHIRSVVTYVNKYNVAGIGVAP